ncbi:expressed unknown protein [Seminavis robusta]|uniref:Uncharacterized protein n=1 Tax=Seminavis robusta TaxID=568900 RepID=A0A9N8H7I0_9STRA|nr:expressed unknown protein [Seminavis robusta]|eukprot:Sro68_g038310.1 n/a (283) ;mRNA; r:115575-116423
MSVEQQQQSNTKLVVATRLHLGNASKDPPSQAKTDQTIANFAKFITTSCPPSTLALIAVDATPKIDGYDYVQAVQQACDKLDDHHKPTVLPVTPWGRFVPALNALVGHAASLQYDYILFCSAETTASKAAIDTLYRHIMDDQDTLVAGALLGGHDYQKDKTVVELNGRTTPWNTLALWRVSKLALTGFQMVSEGYLTTNNDEPSYGVEEVIAIALLQRLLGHDHAKAKLVQLPGDVDWNQDFGQDEERRKWHEDKMKSKLERPARQLQLFGSTSLSGTVYHL